MRIALTCLLTLAALLASGCGSSHVIAAEDARAPVVHLHTGAPAHVAVLVMENEEYGDVLGNRDAPYINGLARRYAVARQMYGISHPSLPNYLALVSGSTFGIDSDCTGCSVTGTSLADQLAAHRLTWRAYEEGIPRACFRGSGAGNYAKKHDPFMYFTGLAHSPACANVVGFPRLAADERAGRLPRFLFVTPDLCHDGHDCSVATGDRFLASFVPGLLRALGPRGLLVLTWDEGSTDNGCCRLARGGHIATVLAGALARPGARLATPTDHLSTLQMIEDLYGLPRLRGAGCACTPSLRPLLRGVG